MQQVTLDQFCKTMVENVCKFKAKHTLEHAENPADYPLEIAEGNDLWLELFLMFLETDEEK